MGAEVVLGEGRERWEDSGERSGAWKGVVRVLGLCQGVWEGLRIPGRLTQSLGAVRFLGKVLRISGRGGVG